MGGGEEGIRTSDNHGGDEKEVNLSHGASFNCWIDIVLLLSDHGNSFIFGHCVLGWRDGGVAVDSHGGDGGEFLKYEV
jgi:hypothetical protein